MKRTAIALVTLLAGGILFAQAEIKAFPLRDAASGKTTLFANDLTVESATAILETWGYSAKPLVGTWYRVRKGEIVAAEIGFSAAGTLEQINLLSPDLAFETIVVGARLVDYSNYYKVQDFDDTLGYISVPVYVGTEAKYACRAKCFLTNGRITQIRANFANLR